MLIAWSHLTTELTGPTVGLRKRVGEARVHGWVRVERVVRRGKDQKGTESIRCLDNLPFNVAKISQQFSNAP